VDKEYLCEAISTLDDCVTVEETFQDSVQYECAYDKTITSEDWVGFTQQEMGDCIDLME